MFAGIAQAIERSEDFFQLRRWNTWTFIGDRDAGMLSPAIEMNAHRACGRCMAHCISYDVFDRAVQKLLRALYFTISSARHLHSAALCRSFEVGVLGNLIQQRTKRNAGVLRWIDKRFDASQSEQPSDHLIEPLRLLLNAVECLRRFFAGPLSRDLKCHRQSS